MVQPIHFPGKLLKDSESNAYANAKNQDLGRQINNGIQRRANPVAPTAGSSGECADGDCQELIQVTVDQYRQIRAGDSYFLVVAGHQSSSLERIVARDGTRLTVQKTGKAKRYAQELALSDYGEELPARFVIC